MNPFQMITWLVIHCDAREDVSIQIREHRKNSLSDYFTPEIVVRRDRNPKRVTSTRFSSRCNYSGRASRLKVFVNGIYSGKTLLPSDLVDYVKIVFNVTADRDGELRLTSIYGVPGQRLDALTSLGVFNLFGANAFEGRPLIPISP